jgi:protein tyrosine phosphatase (PTP) superfamily phosphohydrolase (DUF442 family)
MSRSLSLRAPNACMPLQDVVSCGQLQPGDLEAARDAGVRTIISVLQPYEVPAGQVEETRRLGMTPVHIPFGGPQDLTPENAQALATVLNDESRLPAIVHCMSGNRVGALLAVKSAWVDGLSPADALAIGIAGGLRGLEFEVRRVLDESAA